MEMTITETIPVIGRPYLMKTSILDMVGGHFFLSFDFDTDVETNSTRHGRFVCPLF
jgi:hypothetical protein